MTSIISEIKNLSGNTKGIFFLLFFRTSAYIAKRKLLRILFFWFRVLYKFIIQWNLGIDIPDTVKIGKNFRVYHGMGLVIHENTVIGEHVTLRHNTTIGLKKENGKAPLIGNNVDIGANAVIIGEIKIGDNSIVAAGSVVISDIPSNVIVAGNPARIVKELCV
ncbi:serine O-acetyltransferase [Cecembia lonarensis]|uniref:Serine acetyltransferase n=1 Tax=Cecembia lonarensis (strain CCUG 58316 / KCTC 22772 / LW9) TaxID=1225176 RepID=K1L9M5_CECL9|nr:serine acetyltransferase [Cecembia lonarensis]EKB51326.1 Serine acetyltransferase [Cecembia lonarensis LW9]